MRIARRRIIGGIAVLLLFISIAAPVRECNCLDDGQLKELPEQNSGVNESGSFAPADMRNGVCGNCGKVLLSDEAACPECGFPKPEQGYCDVQELSDIQVIESGKRDVSVVFKGYAVLEGGNTEKPDAKYWTLQLEWGNITVAGMIPLGGSYHGYRFNRLEKVKGGDGIENWRLSAERTDGTVIILETNSAATAEEYYAILKNRNAEKSFTAYEGDTFEAEGMTYKILTINEDRILIRDIAGDVFIVRMDR